jgi:protein-disulfide isomerase
LKEEYIDTGAARLVFRDFPLDGLALRASMLAHCAAPEQYYTLVDVLFATQQQWVSSPNPMQALANIGRQAGIGEADFDACMENEQLADRILRRAREAEEQYGVDSTPSFVINGELMIGNQPIERFETAIERFVDG